MMSGFAFFKTYANKAKPRTPFPTFAVCEIGWSGCLRGFQRHSRFFGEDGLGFADECDEGLLVIDGEVGEHFAVEGDACVLEPFHEAAVGEAVRTGGGVDALVPEFAEHAFARLAIAVGPVLGFHDGVLRVAEEFAAATAEASGLVDHLLAALT